MTSTALSRHRARRSGPSARAAAPTASQSQRSARLIALGRRPLEALLVELGTTPQGLTPEEARQRRRRDGPNVLPEPDRPRMGREFLRQFTYFFALLLWAAAGLAFVGRMPQLGVAIIIVIAANGLFGFLQEYHAEKATRALARLVPHNVEVRRAGRRHQVPAEDVVVGDVLVLRPGDRIAADARLLKSHGLQVDNALLTGESEPAARDADAPLPAERTNVADLPTLLFAGAHVSSGTAEAVVVARADDTLLGGIARLTGAVRQRATPLHQSLRAAARVIALAAIACGLAFFPITLALGMTAQNGFLIAVGIIVALVPEGLLPTVTLSLARSARRMASHGALARHLEAVETLGSTTVICTDKTGTLTHGEMSVQALVTPGGTFEVRGDGYAPTGAILHGGQPLTDEQRRALQPLLWTAARCGNARLLLEEGRWRAVGDPLEGALLALAARGGVDHQTAAHDANRVREFAFDASRRRMSTIHRSPNDAFELQTKGSPEAVLAVCASQSDGVRTWPLEPEDRARILKTASELARRGLRVVAVARRGPLSLLPKSAGDAERDLEFLGLAGMEDALRAEAPAAIGTARRAGLRVLMITGDHPETALHVAEQVGLPHREVLLGDQLPADDAVLAAALVRNPVLARIAPEQKLRIAALLQDRGEVVAMTGDGVNDAPALRRADIGVAMGRSGTDVARGAADLILLDDDFAHLVEAIEGGRAAFDNIRRFLTYHLTDNIAELAPFVAWAVSGGRIPLLISVLQVLALDIGTDLLPALALGAEPAERGTMARPPRSRHARLLDRSVLARAFGFLGPVEAVLSMLMWPAALALFGAATPVALSSTLVFSSIVLMQMANALECRRTRTSLFRVHPGTNRLLGVAVGVGCVVLLAFVYVPRLRELLGMRPLNPAHWALVLLTPLLFLAAEELRKAVARRWSRTGPLALRTHGAALAA